MSGLAKILLESGYEVSGSDIKPTRITEKLADLGASIHIGHSAANIQNSNIVVHSAAIKNENCEYQEAVKHNITLINRSEMLNIIASHYFAVAVTGTHGKTTTGSILAKILFDYSLDPAIILGGVAPFIESNAYFGKGKYSVYEACEAYGSLHYYKPQSVVITNLDLDHIDYFQSINSLKEEFIDFIKCIPFYGKLFINGDDPDLVDIIKNFKKPVCLFGTKESKLNLKAKNIKYLSSSTNFDLEYDKQYIGTISSPLFGEHNVYNALAAIAAALYLKIDFNSIAKSILTFVNSDRRLQLVGEKRNVKVFNDYAHHPTEVKATLEAMRQFDNKSRLIAVFQPHLFSRTKMFYKEFANALALSDFTCILPIYPAREKPINGVSADLIAQELKLNYQNSEFKLLSSKNSLLDFLDSFLQADDVLLLMGAGDIEELGDKIITRF